MRLINTETLQLEEFMGDCPEPYAILSHTWGAEEVNMQQMVQATSNADGAAAIRKKEGFLKIDMSAQIAKAEDYKYVWVDTCCIDKTSSAELSEAINSMFRWYRDSSKCYAYLADVPSSAEMDRYGSKPKGLLDSRWFKRGWTLQELIAPKSLRFYSQSWTVMGTKEELAHEIKISTGIPEKVIKTGDPSSECVAHRMSWAASRSTTRVEDMAYSLMGIFDINMPLLYGEGSKAFMRLQEEIMRTSDDYTILAWKDKRTIEEGPSYYSYRSLLARCPTEFSNTEDFAPREDEESMINPFINTNIGLNVNLKLILVSAAKPLGFTPPLDTRDKSDEYIAILPVARRGAIVAIQLKRLSPKGRHFVRVRPDILYFNTETQSSTNPGFSSISIYVRNALRIPPDHQSLRFGGFVVAEADYHDLGSSITLGSAKYAVVARHGTWQPDKRLLQFSPMPPDDRTTIVGHLVFHDLRFRLYFVVRTGFDPMFRFLDGVTETPEDFNEDWSWDAWTLGSRYTRLQVPRGNTGIDITIRWAVKLVDNDLVVLEPHINIHSMSQPPKPQPPPNPRGFFQ